MENKENEIIAKLACRTILGTRAGISAQEIEERIENLKKNCTAEEKEVIDEVYEIIKNNGYLQLMHDGKFNQQNIMTEVIAQVLEDKLISNQPEQNAKEGKLDLTQMYLPELLVEDSIQYVPCRNVTSHIYPLDRQRMITIFKMGSLKYTVGNLVNDSISHYKIVIRDINGKVVMVDNLYANIIVAEMDNPAYRNVVLHELLANQEDKTLNSFGYAGEVEKAMEGQNVSYNIHHSGESYTAVRLYETRERARKEQESQIEGERGVK